MTPNCAGRRARRIEQDGVEVLLRSPRRHISADQLGFERQAGEIFLQPLEPPRRAIDRRDFGAGGDKLRRLAAGRGAQIRDAQARDIAEEPRRDRGGCVLHPPRSSDLQNPAAR